MKNAKLIRLERNLGFTGGNNVAYKARTPNSKYIVLLNNDAIPYPDSLKKMVENMETYNKLGGCQGIILNYESDLIDTAGNYISELLTIHFLFSKKHYSVMKKPVYITYADGSYSIYRIEAVKKAVGYDNKLFDDCMFAYYDDNILGLKIWCSGYKIMSYPFLAARHRRSSSFKKARLLQLYLNLRGRVVLNTISNSRYREIVDLSFIRSALLSPISSTRRETGARSRELQKTIIRAYFEGKEIGKMKKSNGEMINLYKAPIIKTGILKSLTGIILPRRFISLLIENDLKRTLLVEKCGICALWLN
jgi:GT2 family glycosyltransferase